jgi:methionyl aminopeptidase
MVIESEQDLHGMQAAGRIVRRTLDAMRAAVAAGVTTGALDEVARQVFRETGARSAPQLVYAFPGATCISVNDELVHGIPSAKRRLRAGDLVKLDVTVELGGYMADACESVVVAGAATGDDAARALIETARVAFAAGLEQARPGRRALDIGRAVERAVHERGASVVAALQGHGIGRTIHEAPMVPNWADPAARDWLVEGQVLTIEPIIAAGGGGMREDDDGWTLRTADGSLAAHHEHTLVIRGRGPLLLTAAE